MDLSKLSDADLQALAAGDMSKVSTAGLHMLSGKAAPQPETEDPGFGKTMLIGAGRTFDRIGKGMEQLYYGARSGLHQNTTSDLVAGGNEWDRKQAQLKQQAQSDDEAYKRLKDIRPWATGIGESLPSMAVPAGGAASLAGNALRMGVAGALPGVLEYGSARDRAQRGAIGFATGAAVPVAAGALKTVKSFVEPLTSKGRDAVAGRVLNRVAGDSANDVAARLASASELVPGSVPTAAQVAESGGISALHRAAEQVNPEAYTRRAMEQSSARMNALRKIAGTEADKLAQQDLVNRTAKKLYGTAFNEYMDVTPDLVNLASRPSMRAAEKRAISLSKEFSYPFESTLDNLRPKFIPGTSRGMEARVLQQAPNELKPIETPELWINAKKVVPEPSMRGLGVTKEINDLIYGGRLPQRYVEVPGEVSEKVIPAGRMAQDMVEIPPLSSVPVKDVHTLKMGMDALLSDRTLGIAGREADAIRATRERLIDMMPESYKAARRAHIELNKPIHQMDIASELMDKIAPALSDYGALARETGAKYANALRSADVVAKNVTGLKNAKMGDIMTPEQMQTLTAIGQDLARKANEQNLGRGVGSDTFQKIAMNNIAQQSGMPRLAGGLLEMPGISRATRWIYQNADDQMRGLLADALLNPQQAAGLMKAASKNALLPNSPNTRKVLEQSALRAGLLAVPAVNAPVDR